MMKSKYKVLLNFILVIAIFGVLGGVTTWLKVPGGDSMSSSGISSSGYASLNNGTYMFYATGGASNSRENPTVVYPGEHYKLATPHKTGFYFKGWFLDKEFTKEIKQITYYGKGYVVLYAKWSRVLNNRESVENYKYIQKKSLRSNVIYLKDCEYSFLEDMLIPGMPTTREDAWYNSFIYSQSQYPQGICFTDDYVLITSYSEGSENLGELMVLDVNTGKYLFTLGLDPKSHLGGITFDGENIWICNSADNTLMRLSYEFISNMVRENEGNVVDATGVVDVYEVSNIPSCITYYGNRLWVGTHTKIMESKMVAYYYDKKADELKKLSKYKIPAQVQGIAFDEDGSIYLSTSYGRKLSSYIRKYNSLVDLSTDPKKASLIIEMPPCSEEIDIVNGELMCIFESAGEKYFEGTDGNGESTSPIDKILKIELDSLP